MKKLNVLLACEESNVVREEFIRLGHNAWSCDLQPGRIPGNHFQCDVRDVLTKGWDLMIAFPPCTHIAISGARYFKAKQKSGVQQEAVEFFLTLANAPIPHKALENPVGIMSTVWRKPDQIVQPWMFGDDASKKTCLWLDNLPKLTATDVLVKARYSNQTPSGQNKLGPSPDRAKIRSTTYLGIAKAMAEQWSAYLLDTVFSNQSLTALVSIV